MCVFVCVCLCASRYGQMFVSICNMDVGQHVANFYRLIEWFASFDVVIDTMTERYENREKERENERERESQREKRKGQVDTESGCLIIL